MKLESIGKALAGGFGDRVLIGMLMGFLDNVTQARAYEYIRDGLKLGYWASDSDWRKFRRMAKGANIGSLTSQDVIKELQKHRVDILGVILNHPKGREWLDNQIANMKEKLDLE